MCSTGRSARKRQAAENEATLKRWADDDRIYAGVNALNNAIGYEDAKAVPLDESRYADIKFLTKNLSDMVNERRRSARVLETASREADAQRSRDKFAERNLSYNTVKQDAINNAMIDLNKERGLVERDAGFTMARQGLSGGSQDVDTSKDILDTFQQGVLKAGSMGSAVATNNRSADETTRMRLIAGVRSGLDAGVATENAFSEMKNNSAKARDDAATQSLKGFFDTLANRYKMSAQDSGFLAQNPLTGRNNSAVNTKGYGGTETKTT